MMSLLQESLLHRVKGEGVFLGFVGHHSSDAVTIKIPFGKDISLYRPALCPNFSCWVNLSDL